MFAYIVRRKAKTRIPIARYVSSSVIGSAQPRPPGGEQHGVPYAGVQRRYEVQVPRSSPTAAGVAVSRTTGRESLNPRCDLSVSA